MRKAKFLMSLILGVILMAACTNNSPSKKVIYISAASSLKSPVTEWKGLFEKKHPDIEIKTNFGASGILINQIKKGAPADLIFSAQKLNRFKNDQEMINLKQEGVIASNELVFVAGKNVKLPVNKIEDIPLKSKLGIGDPKFVPAGFYAKKALEHVRHSDTEIVFSQNAVHLKGLVETGAVDYAIMYKTDALSSKRITILETIPQNWYPVIEYPVYQVKTKKKQTKQFLTYVKSHEGQQILKKYHFRESVMK